MTTATSTRTPQNNRFIKKNNEQTQSLCTCVICTLYMSLPISAKQQREMTNFKVFLENASTRRWIFHSPSLLESRSDQSSSWILRLHCTSWTNWNNREVVEVTRSYIFKRRFRCRCRRRCFNSPFTGSLRLELLSYLFLSFLLGKYFLTDKCPFY